MSLNYERDVDLDELLELHKENVKREINTRLPCVVEAYDVKKKRVSVRVPFSRHFANDDDTTQERKFSKFDDVPIDWPILGAGWVLTCPLKKGDIGWLNFCQIPTDEWWASDGKTDVTPLLPESHLIGDCSFEPGARTSKNNPGTAHEKNIILEHEDGKIKLELDPTGKVNLVCERLNIGSDSASKALANGVKVQEVVDKLFAFCTAVQTVSEANGGLLLPGLLAPVSVGGPTAPDIKSGKAFTND
jgi:hypothetical protein